VAVRTGDWDWLLATLAEVDTVLTERGARRWLRYATDEVEVLRGVDIGARPEERVAIAIQSEDPQELVNGMQMASERDLLNGAVAAAVAWARRIRDEANWFSDAWPMVGRAAVHAGDVELARHALGWMSQRKSAGAVGMGALALGAGIAALEGRRSEAITHYREALDRFRDLGLPYDVALVAFDMAAVLPADEPAVVAAVAEARAILTGLGARPLLARLDELAPAPAPPAAVSA